MDAETLKAVSKKVYRKFPELSGSRPKVEKRKSSQAKNVKKKQTFLLIYKGKAKGPGGKSIPRRVRVHADSSGKILKMSTSR